MNIKTLIGVALLCLSFAAAAQYQVISQAYEIALSDFRAPATENGCAAFKEECEECDYKVVRVTSGTLYVVNGKTVRLKEFRKAVSQVHDRDEVTLTVLHHLESDTIEMIAVSL